MTIEDVLRIVALSGGILLALALFASLALSKKIGHGATTAIATVLTLAGTVLIGYGIGGPAETGNSIGIGVLLATGAFWGCALMLG